MAFTVNDFQDMLVILQQHPEWRRQLLVVLLPEDFLKLPESVEALTQAVAALTERQERTEAAVQALMQAVAALAERQERTEAAIQSLIERQERTEVAIQSLTERQERTEVAIQSLTERQERLDASIQALSDRIDRLGAWIERYIERTDARLAELQDDSGRLKGMELELKYQFRAPAYFGHLIARGNMATNRVGQWLIDARKAGEISEWERRQVMAADLLWSGRVWEIDLPVILVIEVSWRVMVHDVDRAADRAAILRRLGHVALPVVGGEFWHDEAKALAASRRVVMGTDGIIDDESWQSALEEARRRVAG